MMRYLILFLLLSLLVVVPFTLNAQDETDSLFVTSVGLLDADGSAFYSVMAASSPDQDFTDLTITSTLPEGATFVDVFWTPEAATFVGEEDGVVTWTLPELAADTIIGPFTYQVTFEDEEAVIPANVAAAVTWSAGEVNAQLSEEGLSAYEDSGSITIDAAGTDGLIQVEKTGVYMLVPADAFDQPVTFIFERQTFSEDADLPPMPEGDDIWWCALYDLTIEPAGVEISQPIFILFPTRRTLTPGMDVINFLRQPEGDWEVWEGTEASQVSLNGNHIVTSFNDIALMPELRFSAGVSTPKRNIGTVTSYSAPGSGSGWVDPDPKPWTDPDPKP